jgi:DNA polymerase V
LDRIYRSGIPYKKAGVLLLDLQPRASAPPSLFGAANPRRDHLMDVIDNLNRKFGSSAVSYGQIPQARTWYMNQHHRSPRYTTHWQELPMVK